MKILGIDVGIHHLGLCVCTISDTFELESLDWISVLNIQNYTHQYGLSRAECKLPHGNTVTDWLNHIYQEYDFIFKNVNKILIERQPITGLTCVEQLIYSKFRDKSELIHPTKMHKYFNIHRFDYEKRKKCTTIIARKTIDQYASVNILKSYLEYPRKHDIADSICIILYAIHEYKLVFNKKQKEFEIKSNFEELHQVGFDEYFNQFRCK